MRHLSHLGHPCLFLGCHLADPRPHRSLGKVLEPPASDHQVVAVAAIWVLVVEDRFDRVGLLPEPGVAEVDPFIRDRGEDVSPLFAKGSSKTFV
jgi:hypothetical protein